MDPLTIGMIAAPILGGALGNIFSQGDASRAGDAMRAALRAYQDISLPKLGDLNLEQLASVGALTPQMEAFLGLGPSAMEGLPLNPQARQQYMQGLDFFNQRMNAGLTPADKVLSELGLTNALGSAQAQNSAVLQNMQARGMGGSGNELIARLNAGQQAAEMARRSGVDLAQQAQQAKMLAAGQFMQGAGNLRSQDFGEASAKAQAADQVARYNNQMSNAAMMRNVDRTNMGSQFNLQNQQNIANQNVGLRNQQQMYNKFQIPQQNFQNQMQRAAGLAGQQQNMGQYYGNQAANTQNMWSGIGKGVAGGFMGYNQMQNANKLNDAQIAWYNSMTPKAANDISIDDEPNIGYSKSGQYPTPYTD